MNPQSNQHDRIGEICDDLEFQNREVERLRDAIRSFVADYEKIRWGWDGDCGSTDLVDALCDSIAANRNQNQNDDIRN